MRGVAHSVYILRQNGRQIGGEFRNRHAAQRELENYVRRHRIPPGLVRVAEVKPEYLHVLMAQPRTKRYRQGLKLQSPCFSGRH